jgi:hypothetical protein
MQTLSGDKGTDQLFWMFLVENRARKLLSSNI